LSTESICELYSQPVLTSSDCLTALSEQVTETLKTVLQPRKDEVGAHHGRRYVDKSQFIFRDGLFNGLAEAKGNGEKLLDDAVS
jgi:hypothetical protein